MQRNGFFIECGAFDGETRSNTLMLERELDWSGVLIEGDPLNLMQCLSKHRKAWLVPACLSTVKSTITIPNRVFPKDDEINCLPFKGILKALNR